MNKRWLHILYYAASLAISLVIDLWFPAAKSVLCDVPANSEKKQELPGLAIGLIPELPIQITSKPRINPTIVPDESHPTDLCWQSFYLGGSDQEWLKETRCNSIRGDGIDSN